MPFITEELWQALYERKAGESIMCEKLEMATSSMDDRKLIADIDHMKQIVSGVRMVRSQKNIAPKESLKLQVIGENHYKAYDAVISKMANLTDIAVVAAGSVYTVDFGNEINKDAGTYKVGVVVKGDSTGSTTDSEAQLKHLEGFLIGVRKKLSNERFVANAPEAVVEMERKKEHDSLEKISSLKETISELKKLKA